MNIIIIVLSDYLIDSNFWSKESTVEIKSWLSRRNPWYTYSPSGYSANCIKLWMYCFDILSRCDHNLREIINMIILDMHQLQKMYKCYFPVKSKVALHRCIQLLSLIITKQLKFFWNQDSFMVHKWNHKLIFTIVCQTDSVIQNCQFTGFDQIAWINAV